MFIGASIERPSQEDKWGLTFIPTRLSKDRDVTASAEWGLGEPVYIHFAVQDTGRGLNELEKKQLFQRFSQANPKTHVTYGGSGLGLFISRELVELQGGEIGVASEAGKGSTFAFYVKGRRSEPPSSDSEAVVHGRYQTRKGARGQTLKFNGQASSPTPSATGFPLSTSVSFPEGKLSVLVVEDNLINQKVLATQLRKIGCEVSVANHGGEAIDLIKQSMFYRDKARDGTRIDVVLMDLEMPVMDGQTCARKVRQMQSTGELVRHIPMIAVTANAREEQIKMTLQSGIDDVVSKPFRIPELVPKMRDVVARFATPTRED
jgi:CheY-like chemotaxis protein